MRQITQDQTAYDTHGEALKVANKKQWVKALALTNLAIKKQPKEARFHITKGRLLGETGKNNAAIGAFNQATAIEPQYFAGFLHRGLLLQELKRNKEAKRDLLASNKLFETSVANYYLGEIALSDKQSQSAISYYRRAAKGQGQAAQAAASRLQQLGTR